MFSKHWVEIFFPKELSELWDSKLSPVLALSNRVEIAQSDLLLIKDSITWILYF